MSSKQLTVSTDNLLSLRMDTYLQLSSSLPSRLYSDPSRLTASSAVATDIHEPVRQKRRLSSSAKRTLDRRHIEKQLQCAEVSVDSAQSTDADMLHHELTDVRTVQLESDSEAVDVHSAGYYRDSTPPVIQQRMKLPRSGSHITRKKAFYNIERPLSIVRRDSSSSASDECVNVAS